MTSVPMVLDCVYLMYDLPALANKIGNFSEMTGRLVRKCLAWFQGHAILCSTCKIAVMKPKACNSSHEPCCVTIYQSSLLVAFCKIYPLQISYLGLEALDKNA